MLDPHPALLTARQRVTRLQAWLQARSAQPVRLIETHISWVLLTDTLAYKLKKPVRLPFLDFSTLAARRRYCEAELRLNRRLAPSLYLDVAEIRDTPAGPQLCDPGAEGNPADAGSVVEVAVRMWRFPDGALWTEQLAAGQLAPAAIDAMAQRLVRFHAEAAVAPPVVAAAEASTPAPPESAYGLAATHAAVTQGLIDALTRAGAGAALAPTVDWPALCAWLQGQLRNLAPLWAERRDAGHVRECHGDLHLANVVQLGDEQGDEVTAFDALEFDEALRWIDPLNDLAFLAMDLLAHGQPALAWRLVDAYLAETGDYGGVPALRFYLVGRALVRAQVRALSAAGAMSQPASQPALEAPSPPTAADYLQLADRLSRSADARLAITHGLPGSGKSHAAQAVLEATGALRLRSDVERKRLFGLGALASSRQHIPGGIYDAGSTTRTYARLLDLAAGLLRAGWPVIVDAACLLQAERAQFAALAANLAVPYAIFDCQAPLVVLRGRIARRQAQGRDASEADADVLQRLSAIAESLTDAERRAAIVIDAVRPAADAARAWLKAPSAASSLNQLDANSAARPM